MRALGSCLALFLGTSACNQTLEGPPAGEQPGANGGQSGSGATSTGGTSSGTGGGAGAVASGGTQAGSGGTAGVPTKPDDVFVATPRAARLSRVQWSNTVRDLLKLSDISDVERDITGDAVVGFDNDVESLFVSDTLRADLYSASEKLAAKVIGDAAALARLVPVDAPADGPGKARAFVASFGERAFRRPISDAEVSAYLALFDQGSVLYPGIDPFVSGANLVIQALLQSPHFLYRTELGTQAVDGKIRLDDYEIASKLSYALTNTMPDDELLAAAARRELGTETNVAAQAARLLAGPRGAEARDHFHFQIFRLGAYDGIVRDPVVFPDFTPATPAAMRGEVLAFLRFIFDAGQGVTEMYTAPVGFVNATLAPLYGVSGMTSSDFVRVDLDPNVRAGLLTQPGFLSSYAIVNDPDTIHRGVFVNQRVLCVELPPPDPNAGALVPPTADMTNRERVEATTGAGTCGEGCHSSIINPPGFAFESFDAVGKYRTTDRGKPIDDASGYDFSDGYREFDGPVEFARALVESTQPHACYATNWMSYLHGRPLDRTEGPMIDYLAAVSRASGLSMQALVLSVVTNPSFRMRLP